MTSNKLDLEKLRKALKASPRPSEAEGPSRKKEYGTGYKSPYSKRIEVKKKTSAPTVIVSLPPPAPPKTTQVDSQKTGNVVPPKPKQQQQQQQIKPTPVKIPEENPKSSFISGYFASQVKRDSTQNGKQNKTIGPLSNAPNILSPEGGAKGGRSSISSQTQGRSSLPPALIPPKPAKTEELPRRSVLIKAADGRKHQKITGSVAFEGEGTNRKSRISLKLDPEALNLSRNIRDGSIDLDLENLADVALDFTGDDTSYEPYGYFNVPAGYNQGDDSLLNIRHESHKKSEETSQEWGEHRAHFMEVIIVYLIFTFLAASLTTVFVFHLNEGFATPTPTNNSTLDRHLRKRRYANLHMWTMVVPCLPTLQLTTLLFRTFPNVSRTTMKWIHGTFEITATICRVVGLTFAFFYHQTNATSFDFYSMHSYCGLLSSILQLVSLLTGITFILPCCTWETRVNLTPLHRYNGNLILLSDIATVLTGCVQIGNRYFSLAAFPEHYKFPYHSFSARTIVLNLIGITSFFAAGSASYLQAHYTFRRRKRPQGVKDLDLDAINRVTERRRTRELDREAKEVVNFGMEDGAPLGSRKSFNLAAKQKYWRALAASKGKSIPALINDEEKQKSNFTDTEFLLSLE